MIEFLIQCVVVVQLYSVDFGVWSILAKRARIKRIASKFALQGQQIIVKKVPCIDLYMHVVYGSYTSYADTLHSFSHGCSVVCAIPWDR